MRNQNLTSGKASWLAIAGGLGIAAIIAIFMLAGESAESAASRFMNALAKGDVPTLVDMTDAPGVPKEEVQKKWEYTTQVAAPNYLFMYKITSSLNPNKESAMVRMMISRNINREGTYDEKFELPMVKRDGKWKVEVRALDRRMYPSLPRL